VAELGTELLNSEAQWCICAC